MKDVNLRLVEVYEVINHLDKNSYSKLPKELFNIIEKNKDKSYEWKYDITKDLSNQNLPRDTICILSYINYEYLLNDEQKEYFRKIHKQNSVKLENEKQLKYDPDSLFKNLDELDDETCDETVENVGALIESKNNFFTKMKNIIRDLISRIKR